MTELRGFSLDVRRATAGLALAALALAVTLAPRPPAAPPAAPAPAASGYGKLPLSFVPNRGQTDARVRYHAQAPGIAASFRRDKVVMSFATRALELHFVGAAPHPKIVPLDRRPGRANYLGAREHHTGIPTFGRLAYRDLWPGIDLAFTGDIDRLKYEFRVAPGADPSDIRLAYTGIDSLALRPDGGLAVSTSGGTLTDAPPRTFQGRSSISSRFALRGERSYGFALGSYNHQRPLVIDPGLEYSTFYGGPEFDQIADVAVTGGSAFVVGTTTAGIPTTAGAFDRFPNGADDVFVAKFDPTGSALEYATYIGGASADEGWSIAVDGLGNAYVTGEADPGFPTTPGAYDPSLGRSDVFALKLNPTGSALVYSTGIGGSGVDTGRAISVDASGSAYVAGSTGSADFPTTPGAFDTTPQSADAFVAKLTPDGSALVYSTLIGGSSLEIAWGLDVGADGSAYITGDTQSADFPTTAGSFDRSFGGSQVDAFVSKVTPAGNALAYSTYLGGASYDRGFDVAVDSLGAAYVTGSTTMPADFPTTAGAFDRSFNGDADVFVTKVATSGAGLDYSTFFGGSSTDYGYGIAVDPAGSPILTGYTGSANLPLTPDAFDTTTGGSDEAYLTKFDPSGSTLIYSTFLGGGPVVGHESGEAVAVDELGDAYIAGNSAAPDFPTTPNAFQTELAGIGDGFVSKFDLIGAPASLDLSPAIASNPLGEGGHCVTATVRDAAGNPAPGIDVTFTVTGATSASGSDTTDGAGEATFCYQGPELPGSDQITATVEPNGPSDYATKTWIVPESTDGCRAKGGGRITAQNDDQATFDVDVRARTATDARGRVGYTDHGPADPFALRSKTIDALACEGRLATIFGHAGSTAFRIDVNDRGTPGRRDTYRILLGSGYDSGTHTLDGGDLRVRG